MCGIVGYIGNQEPKNILLKGLKQLEYRGYDSSGMAIINPDQTQIIRAVGRVSNLESKVEHMTFKGTTGMGHTRWATHGEVSERNSHPHQAGDITLVHNGILENFPQLKGDVLKLGRTLKSETDTEILAHLLDIEIQKGATLSESLLRVLPRLHGSYAFVVCNQKEPNLLVGVSNGIPLWIGPQGEDIHLSSDLSGLSPFTSKGFCLKRGEWAKCRRGNFQVFDFSGNKITENIPLISIDQDNAELNGFEHFMLKEIFEQPLSISRTLQSFNASPVIQTLPFEQWDKVLIVGCGSARHSGLVGQKYFEKLTGIQAQVEYGSEFKDSFKLVTPSTLVVLISQSGETADTLSALREAKARGLSKLSITNVKQSTLARESQFSIFTEAGPEVSVASTKAFTAQVSLLLGLAIQWGLRRGTLEPSQALAIQEKLFTLPGRVEETLNLERHIKRVAEQLLPSHHFFFLGKGILLPIALESALKLKEISYSFAEGYPAGELKHGPLALIDKNSTVIILVPGQSRASLTIEFPNNHSEEKMMIALQEVKSRGATVWAWGAESDFFREESHFFTSLLASDPWTEPILISVVGQLFAYHFAKLKDAEIDTPKNLAKSVTVE